MNTLKLFMILVGCKPKGRHTEQHDVYFGIGNHLEENYPDISAFWPEAGSEIHIDAWREVNYVDGYKIEIMLREGPADFSSEERLFFINLGGYQESVFEERHYFVLAVKQNKMEAVKNAKTTLFFQSHTFGKAASHIDEKYGIDVDDIYHIGDMLTSAQKKKYKIILSPDSSGSEDSIHLGYLRIPRGR